MKIKIITSDQIIWNSTDAYVDIAQAMAKDQDIVIDLHGEGPDAAAIGLYNFIIRCAKNFNYNITRITLLTANALEQHSAIKVVYQPPIHLLQNAKSYLVDIAKKSELKHFGLFIGRSNAPRLQLATYINRCHSDKTVLTYRYNSSDDFHRSNIGLERLISEYNYPYFDQAAAFLKQCPIIPAHATEIKIDTHRDINPAQQLLESDRNEFLATYQNFFVELVCESYFTGQTFFPTEKTFRPMLLKTPFIIQGPKYFLLNLRKLGFQTFDQWWNEGYAEDPDGEQILGISAIIDMLAKKTTYELDLMYRAMLPVLEHNYELALTLTAKDFEKL